MSTSPVNRVRPGVPAGGQYAAALHDESGVQLEAARIRIPSNAALYRGIFEDRPSNGERRGLAREAVDQVLENDDFDVVRDTATKEAVRAEAERDDSMDRALAKVADAGVAPHHLGDELAIALKAIRDRREAIESHYTPTRQDLYEQIAPHISDTPEEYEAALKRTFPYAGPIWYEAMLRNQSLQPVSAQLRELSNMAVVGERDLALHAERPVVSEEENPNFTSHPVNALESAIDGLISHRGDPTCEQNIRYLANHAGGSGYGTVFIRQFAEKRLAAWRHTPIDRFQ
jgi:hypothetical protein